MACRSTLVCDAALGVWTKLALSSLCRRDDVPPNVSAEEPGCRQKARETSTAGATPGLTSASDASGARACPRCPQT